VIRGLFDRWRIRSGLWLWLGLTCLAWLALRWGARLYSNKPQQQTPAGKGRARRAVFFGPSPPPGPTPTTAPPPSHQPQVVHQPLPELPPHHVVLRLGGLAGQRAELALADLQGGGLGAVKVGALGAVKVRRAQPWPRGRTP
jgi:hypothetical protein